MVAALPVPVRGVPVNDRCAALSQSTRALRRARARRRHRALPYEDIRRVTSRHHADKPAVRGGESKILRRHPSEIVVIPSAARNLHLFA